MFTQITRLVPRCVRALIIASMSAAMSVEGLYPSSTMARSRFVGTVPAACTPLGDGGVLVMKRLSSTSTASDVNVPSVNVRNSEVTAPATELPTESPMNATFPGIESRVTTLTLNPGDGSPCWPRKSQAFRRAVCPFEPVSTMSLNQIPSNCR